jgi:hypothetical protein
MPAHELGAVRSNLLVVSHARQQTALLQLSSRLLQVLAGEHGVPAQALVEAGSGVEVVAAMPMLWAMPHQRPSGFPQLCQLQRCHQCKQVCRRPNPMPMARQLLFKQQQKLLWVSHQSWLRRL